MVEETASAFMVSTSNRLVVLVYFDNEPRRRSLKLTKDEATRVAANIAGLPDLLNPKEES